MSKISPSWGLLRMQRVEGNELGKMIKMMRIRLRFVGWRVDSTQNIEANACTDNHSLNLCGGKVGATRKKEPPSQKTPYTRKQEKSNTLSKGIIQKLVTPQISFQTPDIQTKGIIQTVQPCQLS